jgi:tryptophan-rich sensory protein
MSTWYDRLKKPPLTPPKKVFWPVWAGMYALIFISLFTYFLTPAKPNFIPTFFLLVVHFTAGFLWTSLFFTRKKILLALFDLVLLDVTLTAIILLFSQSNLISALLLVPYACWCLFATYLNWGIYRLNPHLWYYHS